MENNKKYRCDFCKTFKYLQKRKKNYKQVEKATLERIEKFEKSKFGDMTISALKYIQKVLAENNIDFIYKYYPDLQMLADDDGKYVYHGVSLGVYINFNPSDYFKLNNNENN